MVRARQAAAAVLLGFCGGADADVVGEFEQFVSDFGRSYGSDAERELRFENFARTLAFVEEENAKNHSYTLGINEFADMSEAEFGETHMRPRAEGAEGASWTGLAYLGEHEVEGGLTLPSTVDWTRAGAVTPVKNQGRCGSCWAFSTTGALEGAWKLASGRLVSLSEQQFVSCDMASLGCKGGNPKMSFAWAVVHRLCTEGSYPYTSGGGSRGWCSLWKELECSTGVPLGHIAGYRSVPASTAGLEQAVAHQPVSIALDGGARVFQTYTGGILQSQCPTQLDHAVLVVGYGEEGGVQYWKIKNSWGANHGEHGYWRLIRGDNRNECGLLNMASYPVVSGRWLQAVAV